MDITFDTYYTYAQLTERLAGLAEQHPRHHATDRAGQDRTRAATSRWSS